VRETTLSERALILAPHGRDARIAVAILQEAKIVSEACPSVPALVEELDEGAGFVVVTEEALRSADLAPLDAWLREQEDWSDLPIVLLTRGGGIERNPVARRYLDILGNVTFIERPFHPTTLVSLAASALRGRRRQYQARARLEALRESESRFLALAENVSQLAWMAEPDGHITWYNKRWYDYTGTTLETMKGWGWRSVHHPDHVDRVLAEVRGRWAAGVAWEGTYLLRSKDGEYRPFLTRAEPIRDEAGRIVRWFGTNTDISDRVRAENALHELTDTLEARVAERTAERDAVWRLSRDLLIVIGSDGIVRVVNPAWESVLGLPPDTVAGRSFRHFVCPDDVEATAGALAEAGHGDLTAFENRVRHRDGTPRWISWHTSREGALVYAYGRNVTEEKARQAELQAAQEALRQSQKMETIGQLTGGIAHDFNNLLQIVTGNLETLQRNMQEGSPRLKRAVEHAMIGATRAATLTHRLLAFARRQPLAPKQVEVNRLVTGMSEILHRTLGETIEIETVLSSGLWPVEVDPNQLENAILNLALNARDAMEGGGKLTIETANTHLDRSYTAQHPEIPPGHYVAICVTDTGTGIPEDDLDRVFEPFFTTKEVGKGTGLGLSMVYGFVKQSGGHVKIYSEPGEGTTIKVYLPRLLAPTDDQAKPAVHVPEGTRDETVLVCEDDAGVRAYSVEALRELGYRVLEAPDAVSCLRLLDEQADDVDLLFSDLVLPGGIDGVRLASEARRRRPSLKVLFTTGYARDAILHQGRLDHEAGVITKPFTYADLAARVRDALDRGRER
jgi:PAS domain S-box-containing protein